MRKKLGLALGAGGARGIAHIGFLQALRDNGIRADLIAGSSMGGIVGGVYAYGMPLEDMEKAAYEMTLSDLLDLDPAFIKTRGFFRGKKVDGLLRKLVGDAKIEDLPFPFACTAVDLLTGELVTLDRGDLVTAMQATSTIAAVFRPVKMEGRLLVDGGTLERVPAKLAREMGAEVVIGVDVMGETITMNEEPKNMIELVQRTFNIMDWRITEEKVKDADLMLYVDQPEVYQMSTKNLDKSVAAGYNTAMENLDRILELINS